MRAGTRETVVRLDGWCEGGLGSFTRLNEFHEANIGPLFFRTALTCFGGYHLNRGGMPLHDAVGINCKKGATA